MILITGAAGKTGRTLIGGLAQRGEPVCAFVRAESQVAQVLAAGAQSAVIGDLSDRLAVRRAAQGVRAIYHICPNMSPDEVAIGRNVIDVPKGDLWKVPLTRYAGGAAGHSNANKGLIARDTSNGGYPKKYKLTDTATGADVPELAGRTFESPWAAHDAYRRIAHRNAVEEALKEVDLPGFAGRSPHHLSVGEKKRAAIATVLSMKPDILVLDEPSSNLDPKHRRVLIDLLKGFSFTMVIASHDLPLLAATCSRICLMEAGRIKVDGKTADILQDSSILEDYDIGVLRHISLRSTA